MATEDDGFSRDAGEKFRSFYLGNVARFSSAERSLSGLLTGLLVRAEIDGRVTTRVKSIESCLEKYDRKYRDDDASVKEDISSRISDLLGARIILIHESDIESCAKLLKNEFNLQDETDKTKALALHDNTFGYKGLHLDLRISKKRQDLAECQYLSGLSFEVQIRSIVQDAWSEVDHRLKYKKSLPDSVRRRVNRLAALFELADQEFDAIRDEVQALEKIGMRQASLRNFSTLVTPFNIRPIYESIMGIKGDFLDHSLEHLVERLRLSGANLTTLELKKILEKNGIKARCLAERSPSTRRAGRKDNLTLRIALYMHDKVRFSNILSVASMALVSEDQKVPYTEFLKKYS